MRAIKIQSKAGRKMSENGFIPEISIPISFWNGDKPLFEHVDIDLDELPEGTVLRVNLKLFDKNVLYFRKEVSATGLPWIRLYKENEDPLDGRAAVGSAWIGFEIAEQLVIIYTPETH